MSKRILVVYATNTGSTKETAEFIAKELCDRGFEAEARPFAQAGDIGGYDGLVIGAPVMGMAWHPEATAFLNARALILVEKPVAYFLLSVAYGVGRASLRRFVLSLLDRAKAVAEPVATGFFGGLMLKDPPLALRLAFGIRKGSPRDSRNWDEVKAFAAEIAQKMA